MFSWTNYLIYLLCYLHPISEFQFLGIPVHTAFFTVGLKKGKYMMG